MKTYKLWLLFLIASFLGISGCREERVDSIIEKTVIAPINVSLTPQECQFDTLEQAKETEGQRKVALVIGVSSFLSKNINALTYTTKDARAFRDMLINDYGYPPENVCLLTDQEATIVNVRKYFQKMTALIKEMPASIPDEKKDVAVFYMSSHGSQVNNHPDDQNGADHEITGKDSTVLLYDSWVNGNWDLVDDEMYRMLGGLLKKTPNISVILDTCHSGSSIRDVGGNIKAIKEAARPEGFRQSSPSNHGTVENIIRHKLVYLGAAQDADFAIELDKLQHGVFTEALLRTSKPIPNTPLTYGELKAKIEHDMRIHKRSQTPVLEGPDHMVVFGTTSRESPPNKLRVINTGAIIELSGTPLIGLGKNAIFNVFDGNVTTQETLNFEKVKAQLVVTNSQAVGQAETEVVEGTLRRQVVVGDIAIMVKPSDAYEVLRVSLMPPDKKNGLSYSLIKEIQEKLATMSSGHNIQLLEAMDKNPEFIVEYSNIDGSATGKRDILIRHSDSQKESEAFVVKKENNDNDGNTAIKIIRQLENLNEQKYYLALNGEGGLVFEDNKTLQVKIEKIPGPLSNDDAATLESKNIKCRNHDLLFPKTDDGYSYNVPVCTKYLVRVTNTAPKNAPPLYIGLMVIGLTGENHGFPDPNENSTEAKLESGETLTLPIVGNSIEGFYAEPPLGHDLFIVFGTTDKRNWHEIGNAKGVGRIQEAKLKPWTLTKIPVYSFDPNEKNP